MRPVHGMIRCGFVTFLSLGVAAGAAAGGKKGEPPNWKGGGSGTTRPEGGVHVDEFVGRTTRLGPFQGGGFHVLDPFDFTFWGEAAWTAQDGSSLRATYTGQVFPSGDPDYPFGFVAELVAVGGTGRLAGAQGRSTMNGGFTGDLFFDLEGSLDFHGK
ncbi:hypothetical protein [Paludisphaera soli]|uniref:hypothetical protein n=1 Tax=Paludisphaera soli TaxID=2712865 RepID=UPI0013EE0A8E|nr:hypothetical protein [Paludisphaera soli]